MLTDQQERFLGRVRSRYRYTLLYGGILISAAIGYACWATRQFNPRQAVPAEPAFDRPLTHIVELFTEPIQRQLERVQPTTKLEAMLLQDLRGQTALVSRFVRLSIRLLVASMLATIGFLCLAIGSTQKQFLDIIDRLRLK